MKFFLPTLLTASFSAFFVFSYNISSSVDDIYEMETSIVETVAFCHPDKEALVALYEATDGANWTNTWDTTTCLVCDWYGVTCSEGGFVNDLNLTTNNLSGNIPPEIGNLIDLNTLLLSNNQLTGNIPSEISNLTYLNYLYLTNNGLTGSIPSGIWDMTELIQLYLNENQLTGSIPSEIGNLVNLTATYYNENLLTGNLPGEIGNLTNLIGFGVRDNQLTGTIPAEIGNLSSLNFLYLQNNNFSGCLDANLSNLCSISTADFSNNPLLPWEGVITNFCDGESSQIGAPCSEGEILEDCSCGVAVCSHPDKPALIELYESTNGQNWTNTWDTTTCNVCDWYGVSCYEGERVAEIQLNNNNLSGSIPDLQLPFLISVRLLDNQISGSIPDFLGVPELEFFRCDQNLLTGTIPDFSNVPKLDYFGCGNNQLTGSIPDFSGVPLLKTFGCSFNQLTGPIPDFLGIPLLEHINCFDNQLTGTIPAFSGIPSLTLLTIGQNQLTGSIPDFSNLPNLQTLRCDQNQLTGPIPDLSPNLESFWCGNNQLTGCFPDYVCDLSFFSAVSNPVLPWQGDHTNFCNGESQIGAPCSEGEILEDCSCGVPVCTNLDKPALIDLYESTNGQNWTNTWDTTTCNVCDWYGITCDESGRVFCIDLDGGNNCTAEDSDGNNLVGTLPSSLENLTFLENLHLSHNSLTGTLPASIGNLTNLVFLELNDNDFTTTLPPEWGALSNLEWLEIDNNAFFGEFPASYGNMSSLVGIFAFNNNLSEEIPSSFSNLTNLQYLTIFDNGFTGALPDMSSSPLIECQLETNMFTDLPDLSSITTWGTQTFQGLIVGNNQLTFEDILPNMPVATYNFNYSPQASFAVNPAVYNVVAGENLTIDLGIDPSVTSNQYEWFQNGLAEVVLNTNSRTFINIQQSASGTYFVQVTNPNAPGLTISSTAIEINVTACPNPDRPALLALYESTGGDNWATSWDTTQCEVCDWYGVTCSPTNGRVTSIDLTCNSLDGFLPSDLEQLTFLEQLIFSDIGAILSGPCEFVPFPFCPTPNFLSGDIPSSLGNLSNLTYLELQADWSNSIPTSFSNLSNLETLIIAGATGATVNFTTSLNNLENLILFGCNLTGGIPDNISNLSSLLTLNLSNNPNLGGGIPNSITSMTTLVSINLDDSGLSGEIPINIGDLSELSNFSVTSNNLTGPIPESLGDVSSLNNFCAQNNNLSGCFPTSFDICLFLTPTINNPLLPFEGNTDEYCFNNQPQIGAPCDDGDSNTFDDTIQENCDCGESCPDINVFLSAVNSSFICEGDVITFDVSFSAGDAPFAIELSNTTTGNSYMFSGLSQFDQVSFSPVTGGSFSITNGTDAIECTSNPSNDQVDVIVSPIPDFSDLSILISDPFCANEEVIVSIASNSYTGGMPTFSYELTGDYNFASDVTEEFTNGEATFSLGILPTTGIINFTLIAVTNEAGCYSEITGENNSISFTINEILTISSIENICSSDNLTYTTSFTIAGGQAPYFVNGQEVSGDIFTSTPMTSGSTYDFTIDDASSCLSVSISNSFSCGCSTFAGNMDLEPLNPCIDESATSIHLNDEILDSNDILNYVMHDSPNNTLGLIYAINFIPTFTLNETAGMEPGVTYYISAFAGDEGTEPGTIDYDDPCLSVSEGTPVIFHNYPTSFTIDTIVCPGDIVTLDAGNPGATYLWSTDETTQTIEVTTAGIYTAIISYFDCEVTGQAQVIFEDQESPIIACPDDVSIAIPAGETSTIVNDIDAITENICSVDLSYLISGATIGDGTDNASGQVFNLGVSNVAYTVSNSIGEMSCNFNVEIYPSEEPCIFSCNDIITAEVLSPTLTTDDISPDDLSVTCPTGIFQLSVFDNDTENTISGPGEFVEVICDYLGQNLLVILTDTNSGNSCYTQLIVTDNSSIEITCPEDVSIAIPISETSTIVNDIDAIVGNVCPLDLSYIITGVTTGEGIDNASGQVFNLGVSNVAYTVSNSIGEM
ncbi:MAG: Leucine-rich repeat (LRR) protein, partial [Saprospiraceae bacterium]